MLLVGMGSIIKSTSKTKTDGGYPLTLRYILFSGYNPLSGKKIIPTKDQFLVYRWVIPIIFRFCDLIGVDRH